MLPAHFELKCFCRRNIVAYGKRTTMTFDVAIRDTNCCLGIPREDAIIQSYALQMIYLKRQEIEYVIRTGYSFL